MCPDGSPPDANGNCPSSPGSNIATMPPPLGERIFILDLVKYPV
jgi:hypothetical protein